MSHLAKNVKHPGFEAWNAGLDRGLFFLSAYAIPLAIALFSVVALIAWVPQYPTETHAKVVPFRVAEDVGGRWDLAAAQAALRDQPEVRFTDNRLSESPYWFVVQALPAPEATPPVTQVPPRPPPRLTRRGRPRASRLRAQRARDYIPLEPTRARTGRGGGSRARPSGRDRDRRPQPWRGTRDRDIVCLRRAPARHLPDRRVHGPQHHRRARDRCPCHRGPAGQPSSAARARGGRRVPSRTRGADAGGAEIHPFTEAHRGAPVDRP